MKYYHFLKATAMSLLLVAGSFVNGYGQSEVTPTFGRFAVNSAFGNQVVGFPFQNLFSDFNFVLTDVGATFRLNKGTKHSFLLGLNLSFTQNNTLGNSTFLGADLAYRYTHPSGAFIGTGFELGTISQSYPRATYFYDQEQGVYQNGDDRFSAGYSGVVFRIGYDFKTRLNSPFSIYLVQKSIFQSPYLELEVFNVMPQNVLAVGVIYSFKKLKN